MSDLIALKPTHEKQVSRRTALALAGMYPMPTNGGDIVVAITRGKEKLFLMNVNGTYWLRSNEWSREHWKAVFGVDGGIDASAPSSDFPERS